MTGFGRAAGDDAQDQWVWEIKSVNGRGLDVRYRLPPELQSLELKLREKIAAHLKRGTVQVNLRLTRKQGQTEIRINEPALAQILAMLEELETRSGLAPSTADGVLNIRGVVEQVEPEESEAENNRRVATLLRGFDDALKDLVDSRIAEGEKLRRLIEGQVAELADLTAQAESRAGEAVTLLRQRLQQQLDEMLGPQSNLPEDRLVQEVAMLATKADIREEIDRLRAHVDNARDLLAASGPVGRKLDFLTQEFNREANTLCSKSPDTALTRIGLDLKAQIDQLKEQVQNVE
ncbi:MAG TPA: YicC family protein [Alphaproteobacteria bacterium]|nr:YicC family protein [Alphaproteobacteria bacterium]HBA42206.1 YicC family protein [Alphaproteobacteria bacterium]HBF97292.1 YicC family protein [Alphaproteobacteria bacterium]HCO91883.1 YicC family protein [Alphaproteobacteria bacterium]